MAGYALVGTIGAVQQSAAGAIGTALYGASETRATNDLLVCWVGGAGTATLPGTPAGWLVAASVAGTSCSAEILYRVATGADAAPSVAAVASTVWSMQLAEFSGNATSSPLDQHGTATGTTSPITATDGGADAAIGELICIAGSVFYSSASGTKTTSDSVNNATMTTTTNTGTVVNHYDFGYGVSTANSAADSNALTYTITHITGAADVLASFKLPPFVFVNRGSRLLLMGVG